MGVPCLPSAAPLTVAALVSREFVDIPPRKWVRFLSGLETGDFSRSERRNGLGTIFVTCLDAFKRGGESTLGISGCKFSGLESESGLILGDSGRLLAMRA